jgi:hypothetical protein
MRTNLDIFSDERAGGPAFPCGEIRTHDTGDIVHSADQGVSKRDWLAVRMESRVSVRNAEALMGERAPVVDADPIAHMQWWAMAEAKYRYLKADAMMEARK